MTEHELNMDPEVTSSGLLAGFSGCWILTECPQFICRVFAFLTAKSLGTCSRVCKAWYLESERVLRRREEIGWVAVGRIEAEQFGDNPDTPDELGPFGVNLNTCLETIGSKPRFIIMFSECKKLCEFASLKYDDEESPNSSLISRKKPLKIIQSRLPKESLVICVYVDGTIGCRPDLSPAGESEGQMGSSCVLLPSIDGVTIDFKNSITYQDSGDHDLTYQADTKCVLVFSSSFHHRRIVRQLTCLKRTMFSKYGTLPVIAGGIAEKVWMEPLTLKRTSSILSFSGPRVNSASILLERTVNTKEAARRKILKLKKAGLSEKRSLAFMFSCVGRGCEFYGEEDVESGVFHEIFPNTPLLGFFGGGEYGCDNLTCGKAMNEPDEEDTGAKERLVQSQTCVICLLSFG